MKAEINYPRIVVGSYIDDLLNDIEYNMKLISLRDSYFEQLSVEKFALETLLQEISIHDDMSSCDVIERIADKMNNYACESQDECQNFIFSVTRDAAMSILDGLYFGFLEGKRSGFYAEEEEDLK